jgi:hypothetical protein
MTIFNWTTTGGGDWSNGANWDQGGLTPGAGEEVHIDEAVGAHFTVTATNQAASTLEITNNNELSISGTFTLSNGTVGSGIAAGSEILINNNGATLVASGTVQNAGTIALAGNGSANQSFIHVAGSLTLQGGGDVTLSGNTLGGAPGATSFIESNGSAATLENAGDTISGAGQIGDANLTFTNDASGVIDANVTGLAAANETLFIQAASFTNHGLAEATGGGILEIDGVNGEWTNAADGTISATGSTLTFGGPFDNLGTITITNSTLNLNGPFTLEDLGTLSYSPATGDTYTNFTNTNSTINLGGTLTLDTVHATITPASIGVGDTLDASKGVFQNLTLTGGTIQGGTVITSSSTPGLGQLNIGQGSTGTIHDSLVKNPGTWTLSGASCESNTLIIDGVLNNTGTVALSATCCDSNQATIEIGADGLKLQGGGEVTLAGNTAGGNCCSGNLIVSNGVAATTLENIDNTISGAGQVGDGLLMVKNDVAGVIDANVGGLSGAENETLYLAPAGLLDNFGTLEATSGGILVVGCCAAHTWTNENGATIRADGATVTLDGGFANYGLMTAVNGGKLTAGDGTNIWTNEVGATVSATGSTLDLIKFNNLCTITATNSTLILNTFDNTLGTITATNSTVELEGNDTLANFGNFHRTGGTVVLFGTLNLDGGMLDTTQGSFANLVVAGGTIDPGTIIEGVGGTIGFCAGNSTLSNVTVDGGLNINSALSCNGAVVHLTNGTKIMNATGTHPGTVTIGRHDLEERRRRHRRRPHRGLQLRSRAR